MIASVYIKGGNIHFYNENRQFTDFGGFAYELGRPLLDFICYEHDRFEDSFSIYASMVDNPFARYAITEAPFFDEVKRSMGELQTREIYVYFYMQMFMEFIYTFAESPRKAVGQLSEKLPGAEKKLRWTIDFEWQESSVQGLQVIHADKERRLFRAAKDVAGLMYEHFCKFQAFIIHEIEILLHYRKEIAVPAGRSINYIDILDEYHDIMGFERYYLERPFRMFYGRVSEKEVEQLHEIQNIEALFRFEFIKMIEHDIFIKKCKNCERFFIPRRRADAEYCERIYGGTSRKCSEIGATVRHEKKVAGNPILEAHKKAYRRFNARTRTKKMTQSEFLCWSDEARIKRDECLAGELPFDEYVAWLEQGRIRKARDGSPNK